MCALLYRNLKPYIPFTLPSQPRHREMVTGLSELKCFSQTAPETIKLSFLDAHLSVDERLWNSPRKDCRVA